MAYASRLAHDPFATYRRIDAAGRTATADGPALVQLLYEELILALRAAAVAAGARRYDVRADRVTRATAILFALEAGLDHDRDRTVSETLARFYAGSRAQIVRASLGTDPAPFRAVADSLDEIAQAWKVAQAA